jgi:hypothetical protein
VERERERGEKEREKEKESERREKGEKEEKRERGKREKSPKPVATKQHQKRATTVNSEALKSRPALSLALRDGKRG